MLQNKMREQIAQTFIDSLEQEQLPWLACWDSNSSVPMNATTGKAYNGLNSFWLTMVQINKGFKDHRWCTFKQAEAKGWKIRKGSKGSLVEYWAYYDKEKHKMLSWAEAAKVNKEDPVYASANLILRSRCYTVFNGDQVEGIPELPQTQTSCRTAESVIAQKDTLIKNMGLKYQEMGNQPYYNPLEDMVVLPPVESFFDSYSFACTLLHECGHATGHSSRLNRDLTGSFGTEAYAKEELRAEIASAFTAQALGLHLTPEQLQPHMDLHTAYIQSWAKVIKDAPEELFKAIKDAERISDYLIEKGEFTATAEDAA